MMCVRYQGRLYGFRSKEILRAFLRAYFGPTTKALGVIGFYATASALGQYLTGGM